MQKINTINPYTFGLVNFGVKGKEETLVISLPNKNVQTITCETKHISINKEITPISKVEAKKIINNKVQYFTELIEELKDMEIEIDTDMSKEINGLKMIIKKIKDFRNIWLTKPEE